MAGTTRRGASSVESVATTSQRHAKPYASFSGTQLVSLCCRSRLASFTFGGHKFFSAAVQPVCDERPRFDRARKAEVGKLQHTVVRDHDVVWFDVAVNDLLFRAATGGPRARRRRAGAHEAHAGKPGSARVTVGTGRSGMSAQAGRLGLPT